MGNEMEMERFNVNTTKFEVAVGGLGKLTKEEAAIIALQIERDINTIGFVAKLPSGKDATIGVRVHISDLTQVHQGTPEVTAPFHHYTLEHWNVVNREIFGRCVEKDDAPMRTGLLVLELAVAPKSGDVIINDAGTHFLLGRGGK